MEKSRRRELKAQAKAVLARRDYEVNEGGIPRASGWLELPEFGSDAEYLQAVIATAAAALFYLDDAPTMELHGRGPEGDSILHLACIWGDLRAVRVLVGAGVDVNALDDMDETPLHNAVNGRYLDVIEFLLAHGASPDIKDAFGYSPREWAVQIGFDDVVAAFDRAAKPTAL